MNITTRSSLSAAQPLIHRTTGARIELKVTPNQVPDVYRIGTRVEIALTRHTDPSLVRLQIRPLDGLSADVAIDQLLPAATMPAHMVPTARSTAMSTAGGSLRLQGAILALQPTLTLTLSPARTSSDAAPVPQTPAGFSDWLTAQCRQHLPHSLSLATTLDTWRHPDPSPARDSSSACGPTTERPQWTGLQARLAGDLLSALPSASDLTEPGRLRQAIRQSGVWLEAELARLTQGHGQDSRPSMDLKAQLTRLADRIRALQRTGTPETSAQGAPRTADPEGTNHPETARQTATDSAGRTTVLASAADDGQMPVSAQPAKALTGMDPGRDMPPREAPPEAISDDRTTQVLRTLDREVAGMIAKIVTNQLITLDSTPDQPRWLLELPFRTPTGIAELEADIRRERRSPDKDDETWHMRLRLDLPRLGPLTIRLSLRADRLSAGLHATSAGTGELLNRNLPLLQERLAAKSIEVASLHAGQRPDPDPPHPAGTGSLHESA